MVKKKISIVLAFVLIFTITFVYNDFGKNKAYAAEVLKKTGRVVSGDYDGDGKDDIAMFYNYGIGNDGNYKTVCHVLLSSGSSFTYTGNNGWFASNSYNADNISGRVVSGDFNGDGKDDIAMFYQYGEHETRCHVLISTGTSFNYQGDNGWFSSTSYDCDKITGRVVSGDYNGDGKDDIAIFYKYGENETRCHVLLSTGSSFTYTGNNGWFASTSYNSEMISERVVSGDFNNDGKDDIAMFYKYSEHETRCHVLLSTGSSFTFTGNGGWFSSTSYDSDKITGRVVSGDYNGDGKDDIAMFYDYGIGNDGNYKTVCHVLISSGSSFTFTGNNGWFNPNSYNSDMITARVVSGDYNGDGKDDIAMLYKYGETETRCHALLSTGTSFNYQGDNGWFHSTSYNPDNLITINNIVQIENFNWPVSGSAYISQYFHDQRYGDPDHRGIDIASYGGNHLSIMASKSGTVIQSGWNGSYGYCVQIRHDNGYVTLYGHLSSINVNLGQNVSQGQNIGFMGSTGNSSGVHLHFEVKLNGVPQNPLNHVTQP